MNNFLRTWKFTMESQDSPCEWKEMHAWALGWKKQNLELTAVIKGIHEGFIFIFSYFSWNSGTIIFRVLIFCHFSVKGIIHTKPYVGGYLREREI